MDALTRRWRRGIVGTLRRIAPRLSGPWVWVETAAVTGIAIALGAWMVPDDPLLVHEEFPWVWFAAVLIALRYGVLAGLASSALIVGAWFWLTPDASSDTVPRLYFLGGLLLVMVSGEFSGLWRTRLRRMAETNGYLEDRIERVTKRLYLLQLSHERLEQDLLSRSTTLRDALFDLRRRLLDQYDATAMPGAAALLEFLSQACQLEVCALYARTVDEDGEARYERVAVAGDAPPLAADDALLAYTEERGELAHVQTAALSHDLPTQHLAVAPVTAGDGRRLGVLVVTRMPFFALNEDTLQLLAVLLATYADTVTIAERSVPLLQRYPDCPIDFAMELVKLQRLQREFRIQTSMVVLAFGNHPLWNDAFDHVLRQRRAPDVIWTRTMKDRTILINLLPVSNRATVEGYLLRMAGSLEQTFGGGFEALNVRTASVALTGADPAAVIDRALGAIK
jgi:hypothetical protein